MLCQIALASQDQSRRACTARGHCKHCGFVTVLSVRWRAPQTSLLKAGALQGYDDAVRMYERGRAYPRELDARGSFGHLPHNA